MHAMVRELRFAPAVCAMRDFLAPHNSWICSTLGCDLSEAVTLECDLELGQLAIDALLPDAEWDGVEAARLEKIQAFVERVEVPTGVSPRVKIVSSRKRGAMVTTQECAWHAEWCDCPFAVWLREIPEPIVVARVPYVSFQGGPVAEWQNWLLATRSSAAAVLNCLGASFQESSKRLKMFGQRSIELASRGYNWDSVILDPTINDLIRRDFESFFEREDWFRKHHLPFRRGYLLYGPPGNGKTSVIRVMASHPAITPMSLDFYNEHLDNSSLTGLFELARQSAPSLVILEDLDRIFVPAGEQDERIKISFQHLLNCLDGVATQDGILVVATANNPSSLGPAIIRRPGRFDRVVAFPLPNLQLRHEYLLRIADALDPESLKPAATEAEGFSYAQLRESYILAGQKAFQRCAPISPDDVLVGIRTIRGGVHEIAHSSGQSTGFRTAARAAFP